MSAKSELLERLRYIDAAVLLRELTDIGIAPSEHNSVANLLRKGLSIVAFNILEDYIKNKAAEALVSLSASTIPFSNLPDSLQESAIFGALNSLGFQSKILKKENPDYKIIIQQETKKIASTGSLPYELSKYALLSSGSNVASREITEFLDAFGIANGWTQLKLISDAIGGGIPDLAQAFNNATYRRHNSAHSASFNYQYLWLENLKSEILAISASIDIAISARCRQARRSPTVRLSAHNLSDDLNFRFFESHRGTFKETKSIGGRSIKNWGTIEDAFASHASRIEGRREFLIALNTSRRIMDWSC